MEKINIFLENHQSEIINIISNMKDEFSSHDFIEKFTQQFESDYIEMLVLYKEKGNSFQSVHSLIARFISIKKEIFKIEKTERKSSENVFGDNDVIQWWRKI
jgi:hypothetical protein